MPSTRPEEASQPRAFRSRLDQSVLVMDTVGSVKPERVVVMSVCRRRQFAVSVLAVSAAVLGWSSAAAQVRVEGRTVRIGVLNTASRPVAGNYDANGYYGALLGELARAGWTEGRNLTIDWRYAEGNLDRHDALAAELVALRPDLIIAGTQPGAVAAMKATATIPIVFVHAPDLSRPAWPTACPVRVGT
jgi:ABC-type uncharacterized transport system substrate-binding protein